MGQAAILTGLATLGMVPLVGDAAARAARGATSPLEGVVDAPQEAVMQRSANPDDYEITFHRSNEPSAFTVLPRYRQGGAEFDGVFAGPRAGMYGDFTHAFVVPKAKILRHYDLKYDVPYEDYQKAVKAVHPEWDDEQIERAFDYVTEDKNIIDQDPEDYADLFKGDSATASNLAQGLRGAVARNLGYDAVEMLDETGTSLQILSGARSMPLPKDMTFDDATREIYESLKNPKNLSSPSPSPLEGTLDMSQAARMQRAAEQGFDVDNILYHGTDQEFDQFNVEGRGKTSGSGAFFTNDPKLAETYLSTWGGRILPVMARKSDMPVVRVTPYEDGEIPNWSEISRANDPIIQYPDGTQDNLFDVFGLDDVTSTDEIAAVAREKGFPGITIEGIRDAGPNSHIYNAKEYLAKKYGINVADDFSNISGSQFAEARKFVDDLYKRSSSITSIFDPSLIRSVNAAFDPAKRGSANLLAGAAGATIGLSALRNIQREDEQSRID
jgi:hypothetical protein